MADLPDFQRRQIVGARLATSSVHKRAILLGASRAAVSKAMTAYTNHGKTSAKRNSDRKPKRSERDRCTL
jgi:predicted transcriptional regulator